MIIVSSQAAISTTFDRVARNFMNLQKQHDDVSGKTRREWTETVVATFDRRKHISGKREKWEQQRMDDMIEEYQKVRRESIRLT
jgi:hypothetical protein